MEVENFLSNQELIIGNFDPGEGKKVQEAGKLYRN